MESDVRFILNAVKCGGISLAALAVAGIIGLMYLSWDKDEDIAGIVAMGAFVAIVSSVIAIAASVLQWRFARKLK